MFGTHKRVFAGKSSLFAEPFCPYLTNEDGYSSLRRTVLRNFLRPNQPHDIRPSIRDGKSHA